MGIFDNNLLSSLVPKIFQPSSGPVDPGRNYVFAQQSGCGAKIYPNGGDNRSSRQLFYEIQSCTCDRTTTDIGGSFTIVLTATHPWDELIQPDDFIRIFMGDQIVQQKNSNGAYNFASGVLDQSKSSPLKADVVMVPLPGAGGNVVGGKVAQGTSFAMNYLAMYERFVGKVDRVEKNVSAPSGQSGSITTYTVSGRSIGAIIQDISLYYNEWLPGLNAINVFFGSSVPLQASPSEFVQQVLSVVLSAVPMPQWNLPDEFIRDMNYGSVQADNVAAAEKNLASFKSRLASAPSLSGSILGAANAIAELNRLVSEIQNVPTNSPYVILSTLGIKTTYGSTFNRSFLNSTTTGLFDLIKHLSNDAFNEFFIDLCPAGNPDGGLASGNIPVPTIVMRQRPYNMTSQMLSGLAEYLKKPASKLGTFPAVDLPGISSSLFDQSKNAVSVFGPLANADIQTYTAALVGQGSPDIFSSAGFHPSMMGYDVGLSSHDRINAFLTLGSYNRGQANQTDRILLSENGGFSVDVESIKRYGFRIMELSTQYAQPDDSKTAQSDFAQILTNFSKTIANWYFMNPQFLNGRIVSRFLPEARLGIPCKYYETRISPTNPYPKMELFYVQGVTDNYTYGQPVTTTLTVIRGIRYDISKNASTTINPAFAALGDLRQRVASTFSKLGA